MVNERWNNNDEAIGISLPEQIAKYILKKIMKGELVQGDKIVEEYIASELKTSRAPVREALYLLQVDNIVERIPRRGTIVKSFTDKEIKEYAEVMAGLIQMAFDMSKDNWRNPAVVAILDQKLDALNEVFVKRKLIDYQQKANLLTSYFFEVADNKALSKFYHESVYILNVFAQVKWKVDTMEHFHPQISCIVALLKASKIEDAKAIVPNLLMDTLE
ncbi:GntR family transcriptional regulator [Gracilibacillus caseinilyticus]|uniref:GntR family transcriptional regulator n=1 Tax=Gracilibacillus caseinilyticus TaxID=2932256 RepID=A0ABY4ERY6_9BACI|nr:GntR family transcriptional regulator [Gracilibacillus caseinilyticus]UOQ46984.1 GntR family transcriptional regulator [Gracilibacillus caseinilyticus]